LFVNRDAATTRLSTSLDVDAETFFGMTGDGGRIVFATLKSLADADSDNALDLYVREGNGVSLLTTDPGAFLNAGPVSRDTRRYLLLTPSALAPEDADAATDLYVVGPSGARLVSGANSTVSIEGGLGMSDDGSRAVFKTIEGLVAADTDLASDVYESVGGELRLLADGAGDVTVNAISDDGSAVFFTVGGTLRVRRAAGAEDVMPGASFVATSANGSRVVVAKDGTLYLRDGSAAPVALAGDATFLGLSADGARVTYAGGGRVFQWQPGGAQAVSGAATFKAVTPDGRSVVYETAAALTADDTARAGPRWSSSG
jgi:hypothetical protein